MRTNLLQPSYEPAPLADGALPSEVDGDHSERSALGLVELLLKNSEKADSLSRDEGRQAEIMPRFLGIALASYLLFGYAMVLLLSIAPAEAYPRQLFAVPAARWTDGAPWSLMAGYTVGLVAASGICLPTFYFFGLLAGVRMSMVQVVGVVLRCTASSAVVLIGVLPIYVAVVLGLIVFHARPEILELYLYLGLALPFLAGLEGVRAIYRVVTGFAETLPLERRCRRQCFLRRLTLSWAACYTVVSPVMIYRLWETFAGGLN
jgi:hypothetical protein